MIGYLFVFGIGLGPLPWTINAEIFSLEHRSLGVSLCTASNWFWNFVVSVSFLTISEATILTEYGAFWLYAVIALFGFIWLYIVLPETKGIPLEKAEDLFNRTQTSAQNTSEDISYSPILKN